MEERLADGSRTLAGRYELGALLGHGGMGTVRDATDLRLGRRVAIKTLRADLAEQPVARRRFETEARAAARLTHPNVVTVFDSGECDGIPYIVMERLPGRTLVDEIALGPLTVDRCRAVGLEILSALDAAHAAGIIHRDIKPGNVLLTESGHVKVSDFGIAKTVDDVDQTQTAELLATPEYLAPERVVGEPASIRSDLYAVGVLFYVALSGVRPFEGATPLAVMHAIERGRPTPLSELRPAVPAGFVTVVERAMSRDPDLRFAGASEIRAALASTRDPDATVEIHTDPGAPTRTVAAVSDGRETQIVDRVGTVPGPSPRRRARPLAALVIGAVVASVILAGVLIGRSERAPATGASVAPRDFDAGKHGVGHHETPRAPRRRDSCTRTGDREVMPGGRRMIVVAALAVALALSGCGSGSNAGMSGAARSALETLVQRVRYAAEASDRPATQRALTDLVAALATYRRNGDVSSARAAEILGGVAGVESRLTLVATTTTTSTTTSTTAATTTTVAPPPKGPHHKKSDRKGPGDG